MHNKKALAVIFTLALGWFLIQATASWSAIEDAPRCSSEMALNEIEKLLQLDEVIGDLEVPGTYLSDAGLTDLIEQMDVVEEGVEETRMQELLRLACDLRQQAGDDEVQLQEAQTALDELLLAILYDRMENVAMSTQNRDVTQALIDYLEGRLGPEAFEVAEAFDFEDVSGVEDANPEVEPDPEPEPVGGNFEYYGKLYNLDTDIDLARSTNGMLFFSDELFSLNLTWSDSGENDLELPLIDVGYPPVIVPLYLLSLDLHDIGSGDFFDPDFPEDLSANNFLLNGETLKDIFESGLFDDEDLYDIIVNEYGETGLTIEYAPPPLFEVPEVFKGDDYYRYTWHELMFEEDPKDKEIPPFSATLYTGNNWIAYSYSDLYSRLSQDMQDDFDIIEQELERELFLAFVGTVPGDGSQGHPGPGVDRGAVLRNYGFNDVQSEFLYGAYRQYLIDISRETGIPFFNGGLTDTLFKVTSEYPYLATNDVDFADFLADLLDIEDEVSPFFDEAIEYDGQYLTIGQFFQSMTGYNGYDNENDIFFSRDFYPQEPWFDLSNSFVVFRPDGPEKYTVVYGSSNWLVDHSRYNIDEELSSLDMAIVETYGNQDLLNDIDNDEFVAGSKVPRNLITAEQNQENHAEWDGLDRWGFTGDGKYKYGFQVRGGGSLLAGLTAEDYQFLPYDPYALDWQRISESGFLSYAVQVEEDRVNQKILDMTGDAVAQDLINDVRDYANIRARDAYFVEKADAQAGRVLRDIHGNYVRTQQYILRPDANTVRVHARGHSRRTQGHVHHRLDHELC